MHSNSLLVSVSYRNYMYTMTDKGGGAVEVTSGKASHAWMMIMHSKDSGHDLSVKLNPCLCSFPGCKMAALSVNVVTYLPLVTTVPILTAYNVVSCTVCVLCTTMKSTVCCSLRFAPQWWSICIVCMKSKVLANVHWGLVCTQTISEAQNGRSKCYTETNGVTYQASSAALRCQ